MTKDSLCNGIKVNEIYFIPISLTSKITELFFSFNLDIFIIKKKQKK